MDKYTVDLDQVLNDFEYSELTDQHARNISAKPLNSVDFQPAPVTKHSINNVFHSLNEYLNSGINSGSSLQDKENAGINDNNQVDLKTELSKVEECQNNLSQIVDRDANSTLPSSNQQLTLNNAISTKEVKNIEISSKVLNQENTACKIIKNNVNSTSISNNAAKQETINNESPINLSEQCSDKDNVEFIKADNSQVCLLEAENVESNLLGELINEKKPEHVNTEFECDKIVVDKADSDVGKDEGTSQINESVLEILKENNQSASSNSNILVNIEEDNIESGSCESNIEDFVIEAPDNQLALTGQENGETQLDEPVIVLQEEKGALKSDSSEKDSDQSSEKSFETLLGDTSEIIPLIEADSENNDTPNKEISSISQSTNELETSDIPETTVENIEEDILLELTTEASPKVIGFSTDIDIDENELNKMLEDLELEGESSELEEEEPVAGISKEDLESAASSVGEDNDNKKEETRVEIDSQETSVDLTLKADLGEQEDSEIEQINTKSLKEELCQPQVVECLEIEKPKKIKNNTKNLETSEESSTINEEAIHQNFSEDIENDVKTEEQEEVKEHSNRPQDLPLNNEVKDENIARKINLIGSPGSTPYNNVYVNKSMEPKSAHHDVESDYTSSASPTFSDCSTESTSTASTVSVDDVPKNSKKSVGVKNTNIESEARVESGDGDGGVQGNINSEQETNQNPEETTNIPEEASTNPPDNSSNNSQMGAGDAPVEGPQSSFLDKSWLGKEAPLWIPDADASSCLHCDMKFTVIKRRHHCRACGLVLCSKCCNSKFRLEYLDSEARVCTKCYNILNKDGPNNSASPESGNSPAFRPNPNNPLEYCSTVSPLQQAGQTGAPPPSVMVPVGVLKRKGSNKKSNKSVMFCDGIAPGSDLTNLDQDFNYNSDSKTQKSLVKGPEEVKKKEEPVAPPAAAPAAKVTRDQPKIDEDTGCFIPKSETSLPPTVIINKTDMLYSDCSNSPSVVEMLKNDPLIFAINQNLFVHVKVISMNCCINKQAWCFCSEGLINVGSDEVVYLIEYIEEESFVPKDVFFHVYNVYLDALKGTSIKEYGLSLHNTSNFLDSRNHAGFVYINPTFQCLENVLVPKEPYLIGILIHRWETPWAKLFPLRLILRLGAEYRYYPSPLISSRHRDSVFVEIGHTIINLLADFRNFTYTLPQIRGLIIHMEDKKTTITIPVNRYDQVMKSISNSSEHILAFSGNFSSEADSHLVCIQDTQGHENCYTTHAINIHNKPRKITGASFIVFNGSLKSSSGLTAKSNIVEDGLMIQIPPEHMDKIREDLRNMKNHTIACGCVNATSDETVNIVWGNDDRNFNSGVKSPVDLMDMRGVPSIRVHNGKDYFCNNGTRLIRWTEVFILQNGEDSPKNQDPVDISKVSETIAKACCTALVKYLDLLVSNSCQKIGIRTTLHVEKVSYSGGSNGLKLPPIYMRSLDNELVPALHRITSNNLGDSAIVIELIFRILNA